MRSSNTPPHLSVAIVNYNSGDDLSTCLAALFADADAPSFEIFVVDNASADDSLARAAPLMHHPRVTVLPSPVNLGYAGGVNLALTEARGSYLLALNPDMRVMPGCLARLVEHMQAAPNAGAANPLILLDDGERINAAGQIVHVTGLGFNRWLGQPRARVTGLAPQRVSGIQGGAVILRREALERAGGWDASGFLYHEDVELSWLLQLLGYDLYCVPDAVVEHTYHLSMYPEKLFLLERNRWAMLLTNLSGASWLALWPLMLVTEAMLWGYCLLRGWRFLRAKAASYGWVWRQRAALRARRQWVQSVRSRSDRELLGRLAWAYVWDQVVSLGRERGPSSRQPAGGPPVRLEETR